MPAAGSVEFEILHSTLFYEVEKFPVTPMGLPPGLKLLMAVGLNPVAVNGKHNL